MKVLAVFVLALAVGSISADPLLGLDGDLVETVTDTVNELLDDLFPSIDGLLSTVNDLVYGLGLDAFVDGLVGQVQDTLGNLVGSAQELISSVGAIVQELVDQVEALLNQLVCAVLDLLAGVVPAVENLSRNVNAPVNNLLTKLVSAVAVILEIVYDVLGQIIAAVNKATNYALKKLLKTVKDAIKATRVQVNNFLQGLLADVGTTEDQLLKDVNGILGKFQGTIGDLFQC